MGCLTDDQVQTLAAEVARELDERGHCVIDYERFADDVADAIRGGLRLTEKSN